MKKLLNQLWGLQPSRFWPAGHLPVRMMTRFRQGNRKFNYEADEADYKTIHFTNFSKELLVRNVEFRWCNCDFFWRRSITRMRKTGTYTVVLTASGSGGTATHFEQEIVIENPNAILDALAGSTSKTWKLCVMPALQEDTHCWLVRWRLMERYWWTVVGEWVSDNDEIAIRSCMLNHEYTFTVQDWRSKETCMVQCGPKDMAQRTVSVENICFWYDWSNNMKDKDDGSSLAVWGDFEEPSLLLLEHRINWKLMVLVPIWVLKKLERIWKLKLPSLLWLIISKSCMTVRLIRWWYVLTISLIPVMHSGGYWCSRLFIMITLAMNHQSLEINQQLRSQVLWQEIKTTTNETEEPLATPWDFGDNTTSTAAAPVHTYTSDGIYNVTWQQLMQVVQILWESYLLRTLLRLSSGCVVAGFAWKVRADELSLFVGPAMEATWMVCSAKGWYAWIKACLANDEFKFSAGGVYSYDTKRRRLEMTALLARHWPNKLLHRCTMATTNDGKKYRTFANHTYIHFTAASGANQSKIVVSDGALMQKRSLVFYKAFWGGGE